MTKEFKQKCLICKQNIQTLDYKCSATNYWGGTFNGAKHEQDWDNQDDLTDNQEDNVEYSCPECGAVLFKSEKEARAFLTKK